MFRDGDKPKTENINCLIKHIGMGDMIAALVAVDYIIRTYKHVNLLVWVPDFFLPITKNLLPPGTCARDFTTAAHKYNDKLTGIATGDLCFNSMKTHPVDYAFQILVNKSVSIEYKNYLKFKDSHKIKIDHFNLPENYAVISVGATAPVKLLPSNVIDEISNYLNSKGCTPVYLGSATQPIGLKSADVLPVALDDKINYNLGINLVEKTTLLEATKIISKAKVIIGMEGGLSHLAGCTETPIINSYSFVDPITVAPIRNNQIGYNCSFITPSTDLKCRHCLTNMNFLYEHDFRWCKYSDYKCLMDFTSDKFISKLKEIGI